MTSNDTTHHYNHPQLVSEVCKQLEGAYAILVQSPLYPGELVACRRGSPLIMGVKTAPTHPEQPPIIRSTSLSVKLTSRDTKWFQDVLDSIAESEALECYLASEASAVVEHTKQYVGGGERGLGKRGCGCGCIAPGCVSTWYGVPHVIFHTHTHQQPG